jgi:DNA-directed RNA polymerase specialized sigma24 family protein
LKTGSTHSDPQLLSLLKQRDRASWDWLFEKYAGAMYGLISNILHEKNEAINVLEESFTEISRNLENYDPAKSRLFTWMLQLTRETALKRRKPNQQPVLPNTKAREPLISQLNDEQRQIMQQLYFEGQSPRELARQMNISEAALIQQVKLALSNLYKNY